MGEKVVGRLSMDMEAERFEYPALRNVEMSVRCVDDARRLSRRD